jgi:iron complex outermembrane receptor protein
MQPGMHGSSTSIAGESFAEKRMKPRTEIALFLAAVLAVPGAGAQSVLEEVVVTAQRREQSLQEVPVSVTAFSGESLVRSNIREATEYLSLTPNVSFTHDGQVGSRGLGISVRGVNNLISGENAFINSVGVYLNEFSVASVPNQVINPQLPDMERIEVLRGPQGTYFGRNAVGGALNITTRKPTDRFEGEVIAGAESYKGGDMMWHATGILNLPVSDNLRVRGVVYYEDSGGLVENICAAGTTNPACPTFFTTGGVQTAPNGTKDSGHDYVMGRFLANWTPTDRTTVDLTVIYTHEDQGHDETVPTGVMDLDTIDTFGATDSIDPGTGFWPRNRTRVAHDLDEHNRNRSLVGILSLSHQFTDDILIKSITGVIDARNERLFDNDLIAAADMVKRTNDNEGSSWSTELRMEMTKTQFDWVLGAMYARDRQEHTTRITVAEAADVILPVPPFVLLPPPFFFPVGLCLQCTDKKFEVESVAVFSDFTWHVNDRLDLIVGGRYTHDSVRNAIPFATALVPDPDTFIPFINPIRPPVSNREKFDDFSPRFSARYELTDEVSVYGTISRGYKAGGASVGHFGMTPVAIPFDDESIWTYEIGMKSELLDRRLRLNASAFYAQWSDLQVENFRFLIPGDLSSNFEETVNVDDAEAYGVEIEFVAVPTDRLTISGGIGLLETEITCNCTATLTGGYVAALKGLPVPKSPSLTAHLVGEYRWPFAAGEGWLRVEYIHRDGQFSDIEAVTYRQTRGFPSPNAGLVAPPVVNGFPFRTPDYDVVNLRAGWDWNRFRLNVFVENVFDEAYYTGSQENFGLSGIRVRPNPRVFGGSIAWSFGGI